MNASLTLTYRQALTLNEDQAYQALAQMCWAETGGKPVCPSCASLQVFETNTCYKLRCRDCQKTFSLRGASPFTRSELTLATCLALLLAYIQKTGPQEQVARAMGLDRTSYRDWMDKILEHERIYGLWSMPTNLSSHPGRKPKVSRKVMAFYLLNHRAALRPHVLAAFKQSEPAQVLAVWRELGAKSPKQLAEIVEGVDQVKLKTVALEVSEIQAKAEPYYFAANSFQERELC